MTEGDHFEVGEGLSISSVASQYFGEYGPPQLTERSSVWFELIDTGSNRVGEFLVRSRSIHGGREPVVTTKIVTSEDASFSSELTPQLDDRFTLPVSQQITYTIRGRLRSGASLTPVVVVEPDTNQSDEDLRNNVAPKAARAFVDLQILSTEQSDDRVEIGFRITNQGSADIVDATLHQDLTDVLSDIKWYRDEIPFSSAIDLSKLDGTLGAREIARQEPRASSSNPFPYSEIVRARGFAGDVNGDGYDDFVLGRGLSALRAPPSLAARSILVFGGADFGAGGELASENGTVEIPHQRFSNVMPLGDINGDGFDDLWNTVPTLDSDAQPIQILFGSPDATDELNELERRTRNRKSRSNSLHSRRRSH